MVGRNSLAALGRHLFRSNKQNKNGDLTDLTQVDGGTAVVDAGLTVSLGDLSLAGGWESRFGISTASPALAATMLTLRLNTN